LWGGGSVDFFDIEGLLENTVRIFSAGDDLFCTGVGFRSGSGKSHFHPGKSAAIVFRDGTELGDIGEIHPEVARAFGANRVTALELDIERLYACAGDRKPSFCPLPKFPSVRRDLAFVVDRNLEIGGIVSSLKEISPLVERVWVFDLFEDKSIGDGAKSVGISMLLRSPDKTLTDEEANCVREKAVKTLDSSFGAQIR